MGAQGVLAAGSEAVALRRRGTTRRVGAGEAFARAITDHHQELTRFAFRLCGDLTWAEDVVAEAYARVWPRWRRGRRGPATGGAVGGGVAADVGPR